VSILVTKGVAWGWSTVAFVLSLVPMMSEGRALLGSVSGQLPFGRCVALETSNNFVALVGGDAARFAVRVRFFQRQGYDVETAISSGAIATSGSWLAKSALFLIALGFAAGDFHAPHGSGGDQRAVCI